MWLSLLLCHLLHLAPPLANVGVAIITDLADPHSQCGSVHIRNKTAVGERTAKAALAIAYNKQIAYRGLARLHLPLTTALLYSLLCYCATVLLYCCTAVLLYCCTAVLLYDCTTVLLYCCTPVLLCYGTAVLLCCCTAVLLYSRLSLQCIYSLLYSNYSLPTVVATVCTSLHSLLHSPLYSLYYTHY
jgi:hypothetical protein